MVAINTDINIYYTIEKLLYIKYMKELKWRRYNLKKKWFKKKIGYWQ